MQILVCRDGVTLYRNNTTINAHVKTQNRVKQRSDTLTRDPSTFPARLGTRVHSSQSTLPVNTASRHGP